MAKKKKLTTYEHKEPKHRDVREYRYWGVFAAHGVSVFGPIAQTNHQVLCSTKELADEVVEILNDLIRRSSGDMWLDVQCQGQTWGVKEGWLADVQFDRFANEQSWTRNEKSICRTISSALRQIGLRPH